MICILVTEWLQFVYLAINHSQWLDNIGVSESHAKYWRRLKLSMRGSAFAKSMSKDHQLTMSMAEWQVKSTGRTCGIAVIFFLFFVPTSEEAIHAFLFPHGILSARSIVAMGVSSFCQDFFWIAYCLWRGLNVGPFVHHVFMEDRVVLWWSILFLMASSWLPRVFYEAAWLFTESTA